MFKKFFYLLSVVLGIFLFFKLSSSKDRKYLFKKNISQEPVKEVKSMRIKSKKVLKGLNSRQKDILRLLEKRKVLLPSDIYSLHPDVSTRTLRRDMTGLVDLNIVKQEGSTRDTSYLLIT